VATRAVERDTIGTPFDLHKPRLLPNI